VRELLARKADVNAQGGIFGTPLRAAALRGFEEVVSLLLKNGADPNIAPDDLCNVLQIAISRGRTELVHRLLEPDCEERDPGTEGLGPQKVLTADPNAEDGLFGSPLQEACAYGKEKIVRVLLDHGANAFSEGGIYKNASMAALKNGHEDVLYCLIEHNIAAVPYAMTLQRQRLTRKSSTQVIVPYEKVPLPNVDRAPKRQEKTSAPKKLGIQSKKQIKRLHRRLQKCVKWNYPH
jgi:ankyrin repeat protein